MFLLLLFSCAPEPPAPGVPTPVVEVAPQTTPGVPIRLEFDAPPGARVYVDNKLAGSPPVDLELAIGPHQVRVLSPDGTSVSTTIEVPSPEKTTIHPDFGR